MGQPNLAIARKLGLGKSHFYTSKFYFVPLEVFLNRSLFISLAAEQKSYANLEILF